MHRSIVLSILITSMTLPVFAVPAPAQQNQKQQEQAESKRKLVNREEPEYPPAAKAMRIEGVVRMEVVIAANGTPKAVEVKGGHPLLVRAAVNAVHKWKWAAAPRESRELVEVKFQQ
jgi:periplasmic protein TonB